MKKLYLEAGKNSFVIAALSIILLIISVFAFDKSIKSFSYNNFSFISFLLLLFLGILPFLTALISLKYLFSERTKLIFEIDEEILRVKEQTFTEKEAKVIHEIALKEMECPKYAEELYKLTDGSTAIGEKIIYSRNKNGEEVEIFKTSFPLKTLSDNQVEEIYNFIYAEYSEFQRRTLEN